MVEVMKITVSSFKRSHACTATLSAPTLQPATTDPCLHQRLLGTHGQIWVSLLWGHCFLLGPGVHKVLFVPSKCLFPQSCVSSGSSVVGLMRPPARGLMPYPSLLHPEPLPLWQSSADLVPPQERLKHSFVPVSVGSLGPGVHKVCLSPLSVTGGNGV